MIWKVKVRDDEPDAIVLECNLVSLEQYRYSLIEILKDAIINTNSLDQDDIWNVLSIVQSMYEKGGQA